MQSRFIRDTNEIIDELAVDMDAADLRPDREDFLWAKDGARGLRRPEITLKHRLLGRSVWIIEAHAEHEAIKLCLWERICPRIFNRVLRRDDKEGLRELMRLAFDRDGALLHRL